MPSSLCPKLATLFKVLCFLRFPDLAGGACLFWRIFAGNTSEGRTMHDNRDLLVPNFVDVREAYERIQPHIHQTPVLTSQYLNDLTGAKLFFKCENMQKAAAFKVRGASNAVFGLPELKARKGVATHSLGNHALSLSYAAGRRGIPCTVVMPHTAPDAKKDAVRGYGGGLLNVRHLLQAESRFLPKWWPKAGLILCILTMIPV